MRATTMARILMNPEAAGGGGGTPPGQGGDPGPRPSGDPTPGGDRGSHGNPAPPPGDRERDPSRDASRDPSRDVSPPPPPADPASAGWAAERKQVLAELERYRREEAKRQSAEREAEQERLKKAGEWEKLETRYQEELRRRDEHVAAKDRQYADSILDRDLAVALGGYPWVDGGAEAVAKLIRGEIETYEHEGTIRSRSKDTFKSLPEYLKEKVEKDPLLRHLIRAEGRPGSGATDPHRPAGSPPGNDRARNPGDSAESPAVLSAREFFEKSGRAGSGNAAGYRIG